MNISQASQLIERMKRNSAPKLENLDCPRKNFTVTKSSTLRLSAITPAEPYKKNSIECSISKPKFAETNGNKTSRIGLTHFDLPQKDPIHTKTKTLSSFSLKSPVYQKGNNKIVQPKNRKSEIQGTIRAHSINKDLTECLIIEELSKDEKENLEGQKMQHLKGKLKLLTNNMKGADNKVKNTSSKSYYKSLHAPLSARSDIVEIDKPIVAKHNKAETPLLIKLDNLRNRLKKVMANCPKCITALKSRIAYLLKSNC